MEDRISLLLMLSDSQDSEISIMSRDLLYISDWKKGILFTRLRAFHTRTGIPLVPMELESQLEIKVVGEEVEAVAGKYL